jgi:cyclopropane fatty-acyl-phospholipid synthase-like methyltransferase
MSQEGAPFYTENSKPGDQTLTAYVGPPDRYDTMGASQFRLLCSLGLRARHRVLDIGCGSLRLGRLLIPYLDRGNYVGVEPNNWLVKGGLKEFFSTEDQNFRGSSFYTMDDFSVDSLGLQFDYIIAQSVFSHTGIDLLRKAILAISKVSHERTIFLATYVFESEGKQTPPRGATYSGWKYPDLVSYSFEELIAIYQAVGYSCKRIPWSHPRQTWILAFTQKDLLKDSEISQLHDKCLLLDQ